LLSPPLVAISFSFSVFPFFLILSFLNISGSAPPPDILHGPAWLDGVATPPNTGRLFFHMPFPNLGRPSFGLPWVCPVMVHFFWLISPIPLWPSNPPWANARSFPPQVSLSPIHPPRLVLVCSLHPKSTPAPPGSFLEFQPLAFPTCSGLPSPVLPYPPGHGFSSPPFPYQKNFAQPPCRSREPGLFFPKTKNTDFIGPLPFLRIYHGAEFFTSSTPPFDIPFHPTFP